LIAAHLSVALPPIRAVLRALFQADRAKRQEAGVTLIELVITIVLVGIISGMGAILVMNGTQAYITEDQRAAVTDQGRLGIERMMREIRTIRGQSAADIPTWNAGALQFTDLTGNVISYAVGGGALTRNGTALAADISALTFSYFQRDGVTPATLAANIWVIQINVTVTRGGESQTFRTRVHPRSFV
jgi:prepilin-type N-terminal cleavage/methylation domain-containing protein